MPAGDDYGLSGPFDLESVLMVLALPRNLVGISVWLANGGWEDLLQSFEHRLDVEVCQTLNTLAPCQSAMYRQEHLRSYSTDARTRGRNSSGLRLGSVAEDAP